MRFTIEYHRDGHHVASRIHTNSYSTAQAHYLRVLCDEACTGVTFLDRGEPEAECP